MTTLKRTLPNEKPEIALTKQEMKILDRLVPHQPTDKDRDLAAYLTEVARLGGYLARANDGPPGNAIMWRGVSRLTDIELGYELAKRCG